jgi:hypothetical protein
MSIEKTTNQGIKIYPDEVKAPACGLSYPPIL